MAHILLIASDYAAPRSTNGMLARVFFGELKRRGHRLTALASDRYDVGRADGGDEVRILHTPRWFLLVIFLIKFLSRDWAQLWDIDGFYYRLKAKRLGLQLLRSGSYDVIHSISISYSSHMIADFLKQETGIPWVAQFYDPWVDNFYRHFRYPGIKQRDSLGEASVAHHADLIIHSNRTVERVWLARYGKELEGKITIIPFNLSRMPKKADQPPPPPHDSVTISHIGNFYLSRHSLNFIEAVARVLELHPEKRRLLRINYVGTVTVREKRAIIDKKLEDIFFLAGRLDEEECIPYYMNADIYLAIDASSEIPSLFYPSKLIKYFYFRKPIMGITPPGSPSDYAYREAGYCSIPHDDIDGMCRFLLRALEHDATLQDFDHEYWRNFTNEHVVDLYEENVIAKLLPPSSV